MTSIQRKKRGNRTYLYEVTSKRVGKKVITDWKYIGPEEGTQRVEVSEELMKKLARELLKPGLSKERLQKIAKKHHIKIPATDPKIIILENDLSKKTLYIRIK